MGFLIGLIKCSNIGSRLTTILKIGSNSVLNRHCSTLKNWQLKVGLVIWIMKTLCLCQSNDQSNITIVIYYLNIYISTYTLIMLP